MSNKNWLILFLILIALFAIREGCNQSKSDELIKSVINYSDSAKFERLKNGALISTNNSLTIQSQEQIKMMAASINDTVKQMLKKFKSITNVTYVTNEFKAGGDTSKHNSIPCDFKPFKVGHTDSSYTFKGTVAKDYFSVDTLRVPNKISIVQGRKKVGFMKYEYAIDINNSNPLMVTTNIKDYKYVPEKKWYEKAWVHMAFGAFVGVGTTAVINKKL